MAHVGADAVWNVESGVSGRKWKYWRTVQVPQNLLKYSTWVNEHFCILTLFIHPRLPPQPPADQKGCWWIWSAALTRHQWPGKTQGQTRARWCQRWTAGEWWPPATPAAPTAPSTSWPAGRATSSVWSATQTPAAVNQPCQTGSTQVLII